MPRRRHAASGFSIVETMIAAALLATAVVTLAQLFGVATKSNVDSRGTTYAAMLASQKVEELRSLSWGFDTLGAPVSDLTSDTSASPETPDGGTGLSPSPGDALERNTSGWVDYLDRFGRKLGGGAQPPANTAYIRRWAIQPLAVDPDNALLIQVLVTRRGERGAGDARARLSGQARLTTVRGRKRP